jgi:hypothetical protein
MEMKPYLDSKLNFSFRWGRDSTLYQKQLFGMFYLVMKKVSTRWIPRLLTPDQKLVRKEISQENLISLQAPDSLFSQIVTGRYQWDPATKQESMQCFPKKAKTVFGRKTHGNHFLGVGRNSAY